MKTVFDDGSDFGRAKQVLSKYETSLSGGRVVSKTDGRIVFRGLIDSLEAEIIEAQVLAAERNEPDLCGNLGEVLDYFRALMAAEVRETTLPPPLLFGLDSEEIHRQIMDTKANFGFETPLPSYTHGLLAARINIIRTKIREAELEAVRVFGNSAKCGSKKRDDIIFAMNRLSSALWWLFCKYLSEN